MLTASHIGALADGFAEKLPGVLVGGVMIAVFAWILLRVAKSHNSGTRFLVWMAALAAIGLLFFSGVHTPSSAILTGNAKATAHTPPIQMPGSWAAYIFWTWATCSGIALFRIFLGFWQLRSIRQSCSSVNLSTLAPEVRQEFLQFGSVRRVTLCSSERVTVPTAVGFFRPAVILPSWLIGELSPAELRQIVLHELAHLRRWDDWTNLAQKILRALLFFHPAAWWIESRVSQERENACDDFVLSSTKDPAGYARCLASLAERSFLRRTMALAQAAVSRVHQTSSRVARILRVGTPVATHVRKPALVLVGAFSLACIVVQGRLPKLVVFEDAHPQIQLASNLDRTSHQVPAEMLGAIDASSAAPQGRIEQHRASASVKPANTDSVMQVSDPAVLALLNSESISTPARAQNLRLREQDAEPTVMEAKASDSRQPLPSTAVFVVVEGQEDASSNTAIWRMTVWHVTVYPDGQSVQREVSHRSI